MNSPTLPRLLYFGDAPVEATFHGSALIYRLLQDYPSDRLLVVEMKPLCSAPERRLPRALYRQCAITENRWRFTRLEQCVNSWLLLNVSRHVRHLRRSLQSFVPEAVLTVTQGYPWLIASEFAHREKLPLHLILHDEWPPSMHVFEPLRCQQDRLFRDAYRRAASRLCVSPFMEEEYRETYGVAGEVLYPSWAKDLARFEISPQAYRDRREPLVGAYAGNIFRDGYARLIVSLAERLEARGGRLLLFGPQSPQQLKSWGLNRSNILSQGLVGSQELISRLRAEADFVFVPMSFEPGPDEHNMRISFPSKLTDYTVAGLPILIAGPAYCSAVRWAQRYGPVAEVITSPALEDMDAALSRLEQAPYREHLGRSARELGDRLFSHRAAMDIFHGALRGASRTARDFNAVSAQAP